MKKDKEWLKREIPNLRGYAVIIDGEDGEWEPVITVSMEDIYELINQLDKLEVLSPEWIESNTWNNEHIWRPFVYVDDLQEVLVPKQEDMFNGEEPDEGEVYFAVGLEGAIEISSASNIDEAIERLAEHETNYSIFKKPTIPKFIAEVIEEHKELGYDVYYSIDLIIETNGMGLPSISDWIAEKNKDKYARAWLDGYTVEEEQLFYVVGKDNTAILSKGIDGNPYPREGVFSDYFVGHEDYMLTEQEIKDYDARYMTFAKPVEELEE